MSLASLTARVGNTTIFRFPSFRLRVRRWLAMGWVSCPFRTSNCRYSAADLIPIARHVLPTSQAGLSNADGGRHGVGTLRPFSRFGYVGQDTGCEKSNLFFRPIINLVIPIAPVAGRFIHYLTALRSAAAHHDSNRIGDFLSWVTNVLSRTTK
ncbi:hypothetical protein PMI41_01909 [Phyllobacterium sp. YR531]|nr:hypothetical protein PMI41_01909 [Phyllobacterium sp. YR531]